MFQKPFFPALGLFIVMYAKDNLVIFVECNILLHCQLF